MSDQEEDQQSRMKNPSQANQADDDDDADDDDYKPEEEEEEDEEQQEEQEDDQQQKADDDEEEEEEQEQEPEQEQVEEPEEEEEEEEEEPGLASLYGPDLQDDDQEPDYQQEAEPESEDIDDDAEEAKHQDFSSASKPQKRSHSEIYDSMSAGLGDPILAGPEDPNVVFPPLSVGDSLIEENTLANFNSFPPPPPTFEANGQFELANPLTGDIVRNPEEPAGAGDAEQPSAKRVKSGPE
jgi:hypothetical protein